MTSDSVAARVVVGVCPPRAWARFPDARSQDWACTATETEMYSNHDPLGAALRGAARD